MIEEDVISVILGYSYSIYDSELSVVYILGGLLVGDDGDRK